MGKWADDAAARFLTELDQQRYSDELALIKHHRLVAGAEGWWAKLHKFITQETNAFNKKTRPDFFQVTDSENHVEVVAPMGTLQCWFDNRVPTIKGELKLSGALEPKTLQFGFLARVNNEGQETILIMGADGVATTIEVLGAQLLNPLVA